MFNFQAKRECVCVFFLPTKAHFRDVADWLSADFGGRAEAKVATITATPLPSARKNQAGRSTSVTCREQNLSRIR